MMSPFDICLIFCTIRSMTFWKFLQKTVLMKED